MPVSINDYESLVKDPLSLGLFRALRRMNNVLKVVPITEAGSLVIKGSQWATLPTVGFRDLNEGFTQSTGTVRPVEDRLAIIGSEFQADKAFQKLKQQTLRDPVQQQKDMHELSMSRTFTDHFFNGDIDTNPKGFNGIYKRFSVNIEQGGFPASQVISASGTTDSLKVLASAANAQQFFDKLDEAIYAAGLYNQPDSGSPQGALFMNKTSYLGFQKAARLAGYSIYTKDLLGYVWNIYPNGSLPLIDVGVKVDQSTEIILDTYDPGDAGNDASRIYVARFSTPDGDIDSPGADGLVIVQCGGPEMLGPEEYNLYEVWTPQWIMGISHIGDPYACAVLEDFKMAAS